MKGATHMHERTAALHKMDDSELLRALTDEFERAQRAGHDYGVLGLDQGADVLAVRSAFLRAAKSFHPGRFGQRTPEIRAASTALFVTIKKAYERASANAKTAGATKVAPAAPEPKASASRRIQVTRPSSLERSAESRSTSRPKAPMSPSRRVGRRARTLERLGVSAAPTRNASEVFSKLSDAEQDRDKRFRAAVTQCKRECFSEARVAFQALAIECPGDKRYRAYMHYAWAAEHAQHGDIARAQSEVERALALAPDLASAQQLCAQLASSGQQRGLFSKLFRK